MPRPGIIRADTIDLQDRDAPSAKQHSQLKTESEPPTISAASNPTSHIAPHQAETLREVAADTAEDRRISWSGTSLSDLDKYGPDFATDIANSLNLPQSLFESPDSDDNRLNMAADPQQQQQQQQDALAVAQNGGVSSSEASEEDMDDADDLDDDMMDKISSSPSIEDGWFPHNPTPLIPFPWRSPRSRASLPSLRAVATISVGGSPLATGRPGSSPTSALDLAQSSALGMARPSNFSKREPLAPLPKNAVPSQVLRGMQTSKAPAVSPPCSSRRHPYRHRGKLSETDSTKFEANLRGSMSLPLSVSGLASAPAVRSDIQEEESTGTDIYDTEMGECIDWTTPVDFDDSVHEPVKDLTLPYDGSSDDSDDTEDDDDGATQEDNDKASAFPGSGSMLLDSGWDSECLHNTEDIDFEFVYALHTFMAVVEGQANATKGDTMVLLDDSNSYWWLVRVVKDGSIGYLPAEHIETPTERLARLNKHRNIDLSAMMLGDQAEKTKNPLKSAMRRRKAKTVAFAPPTYVDYSDIDYSTDEEELEVEYFAQEQTQQQRETEEHKEALDDDKEHHLQEQQDQHQAQSSTRAEGGVEVEDETARVEPLKARTPKDKTAVATAEAKEEVNGDASSDRSLPRTSEEVFVASKSETPGPKKTKDGTLRDSFLKDDTVETKKITLTPYMLRDDSAPRTSSDSKDLKQRASLDRLDRDLESVLSKDDKKKKDKKEKDKKAGGFRSLFSRKDKKRTDTDDDESFGKRSIDTNSETTERDRISEETDDGPVQDNEPPSPPAAGPQRHPSKLQKPQPLAAIAEMSPTRKTSNGNSATAAKKETAAPTMRMVGSAGSTDNGSGLETPAAVDATGSAVRNDTTRPQKATKATMRAVLDEFDTDEEATEQEPQRQASVSNGQAKPRQQEPQASAEDGVQGANGLANGPAARSERLSESPVQVSPIMSNHPPALMVDSSSQEGERSSPISSPSPELIGSEGQGGSHEAQDSVTTSTSTTTANAATWNDASLRAFFDSGTDIRDLLVVVYDKTDVVPAGPDHPLVSTLFKEQNTKLAEITTQLDNMLGDWLARKQRMRNTL